MVLVSKLRSDTAASQNAATGSSFFNKLRSTFARSASTSNTALQVCSPTAGDDKQGRLDFKAAQQLSRVHKFDFDQHDDSTSCDSSDGKKSDSPVPFSCYMGSNVVSMADFVYDESLSKPMIKVGYQQHAPPVHFRGTLGDVGSDSPFPGECHDSALNTEPISPASAAQTEPDEEALPGVSIFIDEPTASSTIEPRSSSNDTAQTKGKSKESITELPGRLWDPSDPPAQAPRAGGSMAPRAGASAWDSKKESKDQLAPLASRSRFPARLPPLSKVGLVGSKSLRRLSGNTPVLEVSNLPEPCGLVSPPGQAS